MERIDAAAQIFFFSSTKPTQLNIPSSHDRSRIETNIFLTFFRLVKDQEKYLGAVETCIRLNGIFDVRLGI